MFKLLRLRRAIWEDLNEEGKYCSIVSVTNVCLVYYRVMEMCNMYNYHPKILFSTNA